jgi:hypothetical protein
MMSKSKDLLEESVKGKKMTHLEKSWYTRKMKEIHQHERTMAMLRVMEKDPEMKLFLGVALGSATAVVGALISGTFEIPGTQVLSGSGVQGKWGPGTTMDDSQFRSMIEDLKKNEDYDSAWLKGWVWSTALSKWVYVPQGYVIVINTGEVVKLDEYQARFEVAPDILPMFGIGGMVAWLGIEAWDSVNDWLGLFKNIFSLVGGGFAAFCMLAILVGRMFGRQNPPELIDSLMPL